MAGENINFVPMDNNDPIDIGSKLEEYYKTHGAASTSGKKTKAGSSGRSSSTSSNVTIYSLNQVRNIATSAFENTLGRTPTADELNTFVSSLNAFSKANPSKSVSTGTKTSSSSTTSGGVDVAGFTTSQLQNTTEAKAVKADDIFRGALNTLANRLGG
jgi:hypothetical protein